VQLLGRSIPDLFAHLFHPLLLVTKATRDLFAFMQRANTRLITGPVATATTLLLTGPVHPLRLEHLTEGEQVQLYYFSIGCGLRSLLPLC
jgi:hypothetical protein